MTSILVDAGIANDQQIEQAVLRQRETGRRIGETLIEMGAVTEQDIAWALSRQLGYTYVDIEPSALDPALVRMVPEGILRRLHAVPLLRDDHGLTVALSDPLDNEGLADLEREARSPITICVATATAADAGLDAVFGARIVRPRGYEPPAETESLYDILWENSGVTFLLFHVSTALKRGISEIHFLPGGGQLHVYHRDGSRLTRVASEPAPVLDYLLNRLEALGVPPLGDAAHQRWRVRCPVPPGHAFLEVSLLRGVQGVAVTISPRAELDSAPSLDVLGMDPVDLAELRCLLEMQAGLLFVCGPPGAGVTTTIAALVANTDAAHSRVLAFEPAAVAPLPHATRVHLPPAAAAAIWEEATVAQNADIVILDGVLLGDAVGGVLSPAGSGRLVLAATDWNDSFALLAHLAASARGRSVLADRLVAVIQQRAVAGPGAWESAVSAAAHAHGGPAADPPSVVFEVLLATEPLREAIRAGADPPRLLQVALSHGFHSLAARLRDRVASGTLSALAAARALT